MREAISGPAGDPALHADEAVPALLAQPLKQGPSGHVKAPVDGDRWKVGVDLGKGLKAEVRAGDFLTVKGSVVPEGDGKVSWSAQITIGTLGGNVISAEDIAKVMSATQDTFAGSGARAAAYRIRAPARSARRRSRSDRCATGRTT